MSRPCTIHSIDPFGDYRLEVQSLSWFTLRKTDHPSAEEAERSNSGAIFDEASSH
jgi:hypothetical protein